jgi:hypothetical protein
MTFGLHSLTECTSPPGQYALFSRCNCSKLNGQDAVVGDGVKIEHSQNNQSDQYAINGGRRSRHCAVGSVPE